MAEEKDRDARARRAIPLIAAAITLVVVASLIYIRAGKPVSNLASLEPTPSPIPHLSGNYTATFDFLDPSHGWALVLDYGQAYAFWIFETTDGAAHWRSTFRGTASGDFDFVRFDLLYIHFFDTEHGLAFVGRLYRTLDGGASWAAVDTPGEEPFLTFASPSRGWALQLAGDARLYATSDGGTSWTAVDGRLPPAWLGGFIGTPAELAFREDGEGWLGSSQENPIAYTTLDGGRSWREVRLPPASGVSGYLTNVRLIPGGGVLISVYGSAGPLYARDSFDHGATWREVAFPPAPTTLADVSFVGAFHWWASRFGYVFQTDDGGATWTQKRRAGLPAGWNIEAAHVLDARHAWWSMVATSDSRETAVMMTDDGGASWRAVNVPRPA